MHARINSILKQHNTPLLPEESFYLDYRWLDATKNEPGSLTIYFLAAAFKTIHLAETLTRLEAKTPGSASSLLAHLNYQALPILTPFTPAEALYVIEYLHWGGENKDDFLDHIREYAADAHDKNPSEISDAEALEYARKTGVLTPAQVSTYLPDEHTQPKRTHTLEQLAGHHPELADFTQHLRAARDHAELIRPFQLANFQDYQDEFESGYVWPILITTNAEHPDFMLEMHSEHHQHVVESGLEEDPLLIISVTNPDTPEAARLLMQQVDAFAMQLVHELHALHALTSLKGAT